ncbi:rhodanese-like domain-containing protein [Jannaschia seohaensis]|uniref:Rhodanese-related sulfurtransferase n=1 Tax=Jannaschia seohaensis TaxID=475081 RepID=A0A2Y9C736_9RHOB|nr:rhodanese-like domain-containing protein [Jannaschia seohaensis]PWJ20226.1 rhodanese-related sulfurtransferase [Jannaschia seohaensis]SSA44223.1 Rhodanese-related sulfurtransferase [Jannaschia seohaensis]
MTPISVTICTALCIAFSTLASDAQTLPDAKRTMSGLYVTAAEAATLLEDPDVILLDVRSRAEVAFVGMPHRVSVHIPYMQMPMMPEYDPERRTYAMEINPDFPVAVREWAETQGIRPDQPIIIMCRSGSRSARAADLLAQMGFTRAYSMIDGFEGDRASDGPSAGQRVVNGWRNAGLKWGYAIEDWQAYPDDR